MYVKLFEELISKPMTTGGLMKQNYLLKITLTQEHYDMPRESNVKETDKYFPLLYIIYL